MSHRSTPPRFVFLAAALWLTAIASAFAQNAPDIMLKLSPAQVAKIDALIAGQQGETSFHGQTVALIPRFGGDQSLFLAVNSVLT
jgi:hypothetical protein